MLRPLRLLIVLLVALTVPLQGIAAVTAGVCMALGHHGPEDVAPVEHQHSPSGHEQATHSHADATTDEQQGSSHCPPCVACCAAAAIAPAVTIFIPTPPVGSVLRTATASFSGVTPEKLDRPPLVL